MTLINNGFPKFDHAGSKKRMVHILKAIQPCRGNETIEGFRQFEFPKHVQKHCQKPNVSNKMTMILIDPKIKSNYMWMYCLQ